MPADHDERCSSSRLRASADAIRDAATALIVRTDAVMWQSPAFANHVRDEATRTAITLREIADRLDAASAVRAAEAHGALRVHAA